MATTFTARRPEDLLAAVPVVLGFRPQQSLVMLTFGARHTFHARLDLPPPDHRHGPAEVVEMLLPPCRRHEVEQVAFVVYGDDAALAARLASALVAAFVADGIGIVAVLRAHDGRWSSVPIRAGGSETPPRAFDDASHPFAAQSVVDGRVTRSNREELRATIAPDVDLRRRWRGLVDRPPEVSPEGVAALCELVAGWATRRESPDDEGAARILASIRRVEVRDAMLYAVDRPAARDHVEVWSALLRGAPDPAVPDTAAVTAFCAWLAGDGALAWCALDRCFEVDPDHRLGECLAECLTRALPPSAWREVGDSDQPRSRSA